MNSKTATLYNSLLSSDFDLYCMTETWLTEDILNSELFPSDYVVVRCDRNLRAHGVSRGGGVLLASRVDFSCTTLDLDNIRASAPLIDVVGCRINMKNAFQLLIFVVYIPPALSSNDFQYFLSLLEASNYFNHGNIMIVGDFNVPLYNINLNDSKCIIVNNFLEFCNFSQLNTWVNYNKHLLDLVITNLSCTVEREEMPVLSEDAHHPSLNILVECNTTDAPRFANSNDNRKFNFAKANFPLMYDMLLNTDWSLVLNANCVNVSCSAFYDILYSILQCTVPRYGNSRGKRYYPPWFDQTIIISLRNKHYAHRNYKKYKTDFFYQKFKTLRTQCRLLINSAYKNYIAEVQISLSHDPNKLWSFVHGRKGNTRIPGSMIYNSLELGNSTQIMNAFADYFNSVHMPPSSSGYSHHIGGNISLNIHLSKITEHEIYTKLKSCKDCLLSGTDGIPSFLLRDCAAAFSKPLCHLFNLVLQCSEYPTAWKASRICPVLKKGDPKDVTNYRPISILCNFSKIFESIIYSNIYPFVRCFLSSSQHGFIDKRSTITNLSCFTQYTSEVLDRQGQVDVIYTDFQKAFDQIDHAVLLHKLQYYGFSPALVDLFCSYLTDRQQYVEYRDTRSNIFCPTSGVPQGSNLGPLLFLLFINDIVKPIRCEVLLFADDMKIFTKIESLEDCLLLQSDLSYITVWCQHNNLQLNIDKCKVMTYTKKQNTIEYNYTVNNVILQRCSVYSDLGIIFDCKLSFSDHIGNMISKAYKMYGFIYRNCKDFTDVNCLTLLFNSFVRSRLEYGSLIWCPTYVTYINNIERVQRRFLKYLMYTTDGIYPARGYNYDDMLTRFNYVSLRSRRNISNIKFLYNLLTNKIDCTFLLNKISFNVPRLSSRHLYVFHLPTSRTNIMLRSPIYLMCSSFNAICSTCDINYDSLSQIVNALL